MGRLRKMVNNGEDRVAIRGEFEETESASRTMDSISQVSTPRTQEEGKMVFGLADISSEENRQERASGLMFLDPGQYVSVKLNLPKNKDQRA